MTTTYKVYVQDSDNNMVSGTLEFEKPDGEELAIAVEHPTCTTYIVIDEDDEIYVDDEQA